MSVSISRLKAQIILKNYNIKQIATYLGISASTFYKKLNGKSDFTRGEIERLIAILDITDPMGIFFDEKVT